MKGRPFLVNDMILSNVAGCPLYRHVSEWSLIFFGFILCYALLIDMLARRNRDYSFLVDVHGDEEYLDVGSLESARAFDEESRASINCS